MWVKLIYLRSIAKQVIPTYINHSRPLIPDCIPFFFNDVWEEREARPVLICWAPSKEASGTIFITSLVWRSRGSNPRPPAHGANALTTEPPLLSMCVLLIKHVASPVWICRTAKYYDELLRTVQIGHHISKNVLFKIWIISEHILFYAMSAV